ncbi:Ig-like domain-containing protein [Pseudomonas citronellolis]|uniref:Ig-like domain-containing protein n=1 Tax=Pseudomonas citronellolis TaxID=53408 RepID=UPI002111486C|nr:Ig-like domain-containing protein [Pseudomonas citronellolis]UUC48123.1 Ig-like domain-containing protein [Pseudomonas citronellolis]
MAAIQLIAKSSGQVTDVSGKNLLSLAHPCVVKIAAAPDSIQSIGRNGDSLVIRLKNGEVINIDNFFQAVNGVRHDLVLEAPGGELWLADQNEPWVTTELDSIEQLLAERSDDTYAVFGVLPLAGLGALGVGGLAAAAGGGGGGGGSDGGTATTVADESGNWAFPENTLENGESGSITEPPGNVGPPIVTEPTDVIAPEPPVVTENNGNGLSGTGEPEGIVTVELPDGSTVTTAVDENGNWEFPENPLENGESGSITITDPSGNVSPPTVTEPADVIAPEPPVITDNNGDGLSGTGEPEGIVTVELPDGSTVTTVVDENGNWEFPENPLENGESGNITITDPSGNVSPPTTTEPADVIAPEPPVITDNNGDGLSGTGEPEGIVTVELPDGSTVTTVVDENGNWEFPENPLENGESGSITITDPSGNVSPPTITEPTDVIAPEPPVITDNNGDGLSGTGEPEGIVTVELPDGSTVTTVVDENGNWEFPENPLENGESGNITITDPSGNVSPPTITEPADVIAPEPPVITDNNGNGLGGTGEPEGIVTVELPDGSTVTTVVDENGNWEFPENPLENGETGSVTITDPSGNVSPPTTTEPADVIAPEPPVITDNNGDGLSGTGEPEGIVTVELPDGSTVTTVVDENGNWEFPENPLENGESGSITITDPSGNVGPPTVTEPADVIAPEPPVITDNNGDGLSGTGEPEGIVTVELPDGSTVTTVVDENGHWEFPENPLENGESGTVTITDPSGNVSPPTITDPADVIAPEPPIVIDNNGNGLGGTGEPEGIVTVELPDGSTVTTVVDENGHWEFPENPLENGESGSITVTDPSGNVSPPTTTEPADVIAPEPPVITDSNGDGLSGTGEPEGIVTVELPDGSTITTVVDENGHWEFPENPLENGESGTVTITDPSGNVSPPTITEPADVIAPEPPVITDNNGNGLGGTGEPEGIVTVELPDGSTVTTVVDENGNWEFPENPLENGESGSITITDPSGNVSPPTITEPADTAAPDIIQAEASFSLIDDVGAITGPIAQGGHTDDNQPEFKGQLVAGDAVLVNVYDNGELIGSSLVAADGSWSFIPTQPLVDGEHSLQASAMDAAGNVSAMLPADGWRFTVDTLAPATPDAPTAQDNVGDITGPIDNGVTDDSTPTFSGSAEPGSVITIKDGDEVLGTATVDGDGNWSFTPAQPLTDGEHAISVSASDAAGNVSEPSDVLTIVVDTSDVMVSIEAAIDDVGEPQSLSNAALTNDTTPTLVGKTLADALVVISEDGVEIGSVSADAEGNWSFQLPEQADGEHSYSASVSNGANSGSAEFSLTIDGTAPAPAELVLAIDDQGLVRGPIAAGGVTDDALPMFSGRTEAGAIVTLFDGAEVLGSVTADANGDWSFTPAQPLADGEHSIRAQVADAAGNTSEPGPALAFSVDTAPVSVSVIKASDNVGAKQGDLADKALTDDNRPSLAGTASAGAIVSILDGSTLLGSVLADAAGQWSLELPEQADGSHVYDILATAANGNEASTRFELTIDTQAPDAPALVVVTDNVGTQQGALEAGAASDDSAAVISGSGANPGDLITIHDNGSPIGSAIVDADGNWSYKPETPLAEGEHAISASATDAAGNESAQGPALSFVVDTTAPGAITGLELLDDVEGGAFGSIALGEPSNDATPTYSGHVEGDAVLVRIYDNGELIGSASVDEAGNWRFEPQTPLADGAHSFQAEALDAAGNLGPRSEAWDFVVDTALPETPRITRVQDDFGSQQGDLDKGASTDDVSLNLSGTGSAGATLFLYVRLSDDPQAPSELLGSTVIDANGEWSLASGDLAQFGGDGMKYFWASSQSPSGQMSEAPSEDFPVELHTALPEAPQLLALETEAFTSLVSGNLTSDATPSISGSGAPGSLVQVYDNGQALGSALVDETGNWSFTPQEPLADGPHALTATLTDAVGNVTEPSAPWLFVIDTLAPNVGLDINTAEQLAGQTEPGAIVTVIDKAGEAHSVTADQNGRWSLQPNPLGLGEDGSISVADAAGNQSQPIVIQGDVLASYDLTRYTSQVNTTEAGPQANPSVTTLADGRIVVVWQGGDTGSNNAEVFMQLFAADGVTRIGSEQQVNQRSSYNQDSPQVVALADGGYLVVWESWLAGPDTSNDGIMARRYGADGSPLTDEFAVNQLTAGGQLSVSVVAHPGGGYTISWISDPDGGSTDRIVQRSFDADDQPLGGDVVVGSGTGYGAEGAPAMAAFVDAAHQGMYVTVWSGRNGPGDSSGTGVIGQLHAADGTPLGGNFQVNAGTGNNQDYPDVITLKDGSFVVIWEGNPPGSTGFDVYMAHYSVDPATGAVQQIGPGDVRVNTGIAGDQYKPTAVALDDGGYLVIWGSAGGDGSGSAIFAQRYDAQGHKLGREFLVNPTTEGNQGWAGDNVDMKNLLDATLMADGSVYVTWQSDKADNSSWGIEATVIDIDAGYYSEFRVNGTLGGAQDHSATASLPNGGFVVVWESASGDGSNDCVMAQLFDATGMPLGGEFVVNATTGDFQGKPAVAVLADGSFVVSWTSYAGGSDAIMQQKFGYTYDLDGNISGAQLQGGESRVNVSDADSQRYSSITALEDGGYMLSWKSWEGGGWRIYARQYDADGSPASGDLLVSATHYTSDIIGASISTLADGRVVFTYARNLGGGDAYFRIYDPQTQSFGPELVANQTTANSQASPSVSMLANGNFIVTWDSNDHSGPDQYGYGVWGRIFDTAGTPLGNEFLLSTSTVGDQAMPVVVPRADGSFVVVYQSATDAAPGAGTWGIYAQYFDAAGNKVGQELHINQLVSGDQTQVDATFLDSGKLFVSWTDNGVGDGSGSAIKGSLVDLDETLGLIPPPPLGEGATGLDYVPASPPQISVLSVGLDTNSAERLGGRTEPGATVSVVDAEGVSHTVVADEYGRWDFYPNPLAQGEQGSLSAHDGAGHQAPAVAIQGAALADYQLDRHTVEVNSTEAGPQTNPSAATLADGRIIVVWQSGTGTDVFMQLFEADGVTRVGSEQQVNQRNSGDQDGPQVVALADGGYLVVWESYQAGPDYSGDGIMARRYGTDGTPLTDEFLVNVATPGDQRHPSAVAHPDGGYTINWTSNPDSGSTDLVVQRTFDADNQPLTGDVLVGSGQAYGAEGAPAMAVFGDAAHQGMYVTVWTGRNGPGDASGTGVIGQLYAADGTALGGNFQVNTGAGNDQNNPDVIVLKDGSFVVVWEGNPPGSSGFDVYMAHYSVDPATGAVQQIGMGDVRVNTGIAGDQYKPTAVALDDGGYLVIWGAAGGDGSGSAVFAQRYDAQGHKVGREFLVNPTTDGNQASNEAGSNVLDATLMADGNVYVTWQSDKSDSSGWGIEGTVIDIDAGYFSEFRVNGTLGGAQDHSATASLPNGGFIVVWESATGDDSNDCIMAQLFDAAGMPVGGEFVVNATTGDFQGKPAVAVLADGSFVVNWTSYAGGNDAIMQQKFGYTYDLDGNISGAQPQGGESMVNVNDVGQQRFSSITALEDGGYIVSWSANTSGTSGKWQIFMRQYAADGSPVGGDRLVGDATYHTTAGPDAASLATLLDGTVVIAYNRDIGGAAGVESFFRLYDPATGLLGEEIRANQTSANKQSSPAVSRLANGNFIVTWDSNDHSGLDQSGTSTWGRIFDATGAALGSEFLVSNSTTGDQSEPMVVAREGGGFVVVYVSRSEAAPGSGSYGVYAQFFDDAGRKVGQELHINQLVSGDQMQVDATFLDSGKLFVSWTDNGVGDGNGSAIKGRLVDLDETLGLAPAVAEGGDTHVDYLPVSDAVGTAADDMLDARGYTTASGGEGNDVILIDGTGFAHIDGGAGYDILVWASRNTLDLGQVADKLEGIEAIRLSEGLSQSLTLSLADLLKVTEPDGEARHSLRITGDSGQNGVVDSVDIDLADWVRQAQQVTEGAVTYDVYTSKSASYAHLLIQEGLYVV